MHLTWKQAAGGRNKIGVMSHCYFLFAQMSCSMLSKRNLSGRDNEKLCSRILLCVSGKAYEKCIRGKVRCYSLDLSLDVIRRHLLHVGLS